MMSIAKNVSLVKGKLVNLVNSINYNYVWSGASFAIAFGYFSYQTFLLQKLRFYMNAYESAKPIELDKNLKRRVEQVLSEVKITEEKKKKVEFFHVYGSDVFNSGSLKFNRPVIIGVPLFFRHKSLEDIDVHRLNIFNQQIKWRSKSGQNLLESFVVNEAAQKFAIAREIYFTDNFRIYFKTALILSFLMTPLVVRYLYKKYRQRLFKIGLHEDLITFLTGFASILLYIFSHDNMNQHYEHLSDIKAMQTGPEYYEGSIYFYENELKRNNSIKTMMGDYGPKYFTENGNIKTIFRFNHIPATQRLALIEEWNLPIKDEPPVIL